MGLQKHVAQRTLERQATHVRGAKRTHIMRKASRCVAGKDKDRHALSPCRSKRCGLGGAQYALRGGVHQPPLSVDERRSQRLWVRVYSLQPADARPSRLPSARSVFLAARVLAPVRLWAVHASVARYSAAPCAEEHTRVGTRAIEVSHRCPGVSPPVRTSWPLCRCCSSPRPWRSGPSSPA